MKPDDYLALKTKIITEKAKNKAISEALIKEKGKDLKNLREKVPILYEFWVKSNLIPSESK